MIKVGSKPILEHIINYYIKFGFDDFIIASWLQAFKIIINYFKNKETSCTNKCELTLVLETLTGSRLKKLIRNKSKETFMLTYARDGLS